MSILIAAALMITTAEADMGSKIAAACARPDRQAAMAATDWLSAVCEARRARNEAAAREVPLAPALAQRERFRRVPFNVPAAKIPE